VKLETVDRAPSAHGADVPAITVACQDPEIPRCTQVPSPYTEQDAVTFLRAPPEASAIV
jgi:hypothetical protein